VLRAGQRQLPGTGTAAKRKIFGAVPCGQLLAFFKPWICTTGP